MRLQDLTTPDLYICRERVRRMQGKIWVESKLGEGPTFVVELPAAVEMKAAEKAQGAGGDRLRATAVRA